MLDVRGAGGRACICLAMTPSMRGSAVVAQRSVGRMGWVRAKSAGAAGRAGVGAGAGAGGADDGAEALTPRCARASRLHPACAGTGRSQTHPAHQATLAAASFREQSETLRRTVTGWRHRQVASALRSASRPR